MGEVPRSAFVIMLTPNEFMNSPITNIIYRLNFSIIVSLLYQISCPDECCRLFSYILKSISMNTFLSFAEKPAKAISSISAKAALTGRAFSIPFSVRNTNELRRFPLSMRLSTRPEASILFKRDVRVAGSMRHPPAISFCPAPSCSLKYSRILGWPTVSACSAEAGENLLLNQGLLRHYYVVERTVWHISSLYNVFRLIKVTYNPLLTVYLYREFLYNSCIR